MIKTRIRIKTVFRLLLKAQVISLKEIPREFLFDKLVIPGVVACLLALYWRSVLARSRVIMDTGFETSFVTVVVPGPGLLRAASCGLCYNPVSSDQSATGLRDGRFSQCKSRTFSDRFIRTRPHPCDEKYLLTVKDYDHYH